MPSHQRPRAQEGSNELKKGKIVIYQDKDKKASLEVRLEQETVWLSQVQMADLFGKDIRTVSEHVQNIYKEGELKRNPTVRKFRIVQMEGKRKVERDIDFYNLDVVISVGYRVKSQRGTQFRIWASGVLRNHLIKGVTLNQKRIQELKGKPLDEFRETLALLESARQKALSGDETAGLLEVITDYANAWLLLQKYDEGTLETDRVHKRLSYTLTFADARTGIAELKEELLRKKRSRGPLRPRARPRNRSDPREPQPDFRWPGSLPKHRGKSRAPPLLRHQRSSLCRWQQTDRLVSLHPVSFTEPFPLQEKRGAKDQRQCACGARTSHCRKQTQPEGRDGEAHHQLAHTS